MAKTGCFSALLLMLTVCQPCVFGGEEALVAFWKFDEGTGTTALDSVSGSRDSIEGNFRYIDGVSGSGLKCDGFTTRIVRKAADAPRLRDGFTVEAWVAPQAYPWNWCAIVNQEKEHKAGYFFGIDQLGHVGLHIAVDGKWYQCTSRQAIGFMEKWSHIAGTFDKEKGIMVYINGRLVGSLPVKGKLTHAGDVDLQIGRNHKKTMLDAGSLVRPGVNFPTSYSFDGIIDELKIYSRALSSEQIKHNYEESKPKLAPLLKWRKLPRLGDGEKRFGAVYCRLKFYPEWDALWRISEHQDVVVNFEHTNAKMIFWHGTNYNMNLVTANGRWVGDQSAETGAEAGCAEHMSDKHCRYAHVRIIENHDARVVVHWRYALCDVLYNIAAVDKTTGWGAWADEYYYIYPDGVSVRHFAIRGERGCSITEPTVLNQPGEKAEDNVELSALTMANMAGQSRTYTWDPWPGSGRVGGDFTNPLTNANICIVNLKSKYKPFYIYEPGTRIIPYGGGTRELRSEYSHFPTWNHWPVSQAPSDGRYALVPDRVSSSAITSPEPPWRRRPQDGAAVGRFIMGLSNEPIEKLVPLARSWLKPAELKITGSGFKNPGYSRNQRAYIVKRAPAAKKGGLEARKASRQDSGMQFTLAAGRDSPVVNPAFVIRNWGDCEAGLKIDGKTVNRGQRFRYGLKRTLQGGDLIIWLKVELSRPVRIEVWPVEH